MQFGDFVSRRFKRCQIGHFCFISYGCDNQREGPASTPIHSLAKVAWREIIHGDAVAVARPGAGIEHSLHRRLAFKTTCRVQSAFAREKRCGRSIRCSSTFGAILSSAPRAPLVDLSNFWVEENDLQRGKRHLRSEAALPDPITGSSANKPLSNKRCPLQKSLGAASSQTLSYPCSPCRP
jgi:hypothetical protein